MLGISNYNQIPVLEKTTPTISEIMQLIVILDMLVA